MLDILALPESRRSRHRYYVGLARSESEVRAAQSLRRQIIVDEFGLSSGAVPGAVTDFYDEHCQHLIVRDELDDRVVATCRILAPSAARQLGAYCCEGAFYLTRLDRLRPELVEVGHSCIAPGHRHGAVITLMWLKLAEHMENHGYRHMISRVSVPMRDGGHNAANLFMQLGDVHLAPPECQAMPITRLPYERLANDQVGEVPPLVKGYLRAGAWICGEPAWNADLNSADILLLLPMTRLSPRYYRAPSGHC